jgi:hypothetical protein
VIVESAVAELRTGAPIEDTSVASWPPVPARPSRRGGRHRAGRRGCRRPLIGTALVLALLAVYALAP